MLNLLAANALSIALPIQSSLVPVCFISAWMLIVLMIWSSWQFLRGTVHQAKRMHQVPCAHCQFFTGDYRLKCTLHPSIALTEEAIHCSDYQSADLYHLQEIAVAKK